MGAGALLSFKVTMGSKGPQAMAVSMLPPGCFRTSAEESSSVYSGTVKSFNAERGWGFVTSEEIQLCVEIDDGGQPVAKNAVPLNRGLGGTSQLNAASWSAVATNNAQTVRAAPY